MATFGVAPLLIAALMAGYLILSRRAVGELGFPLDDSWIHVRFAQNLARGRGFSFNPGEPASTTTGPLWTLVLAIGHRLTGEFLFTAATLNWLFCAFTAITAAALARTLIPDARFGAAVALVTAATTPLPWLALSGMEPPLFMLLTLLGVLLHVRLRRARGLRALLPTLVFALAAYSRPEVLLLFPLAMLDRLLMGAAPHGGGSRLRGWLAELVVHTPVYVAVIAPMFIYNYQVTGRPLPSSYYVKAMNYGFTMALAMDNTPMLARTMFVAPARYLAMLVGMWAMNNAVLMAPFLFGFVDMVRRARRSPVGALSGRRGEGPSLLIPLTLVAQPVAWAISTNAQREPWFQGQRYAANLGPLYIIVGLAGLWWLVERRSLARAWLAGGIALALLASLARQPSGARLYAQNVKNITDMQVSTARWLKEHVAPDSLLAMNDVGAIAAISDMRVLDLIGLVSAEVTRNLTLENVRTGAWRRLLWEEVARQRPDYLVIVMRTELYPRYARAGHREVFRIQIDDNITCSGPLVVVFESRWRQEALAQGAVDAANTR